MTDPRMILAAHKQHRMGHFVIPAKIIGDDPVLAYSVMSQFLVINMQMQWGAQGTMIVCTAYHPGFAVVTESTGIPSYQIAVDGQGRMQIQQLRLVNGAAVPNAGPGTKLVQVADGVSAETPPAASDEKPPVVN